MAVGKNDMSEMGEKVTRKTATLVETAADLADEAFETAIDKADMASAETAFQLRERASKARDYARKNSRQIGIAGMIIGAIATIIGIAVIGSKIGRRSNKD